MANSISQSRATAGGKNVLAFSLFGATAGLIWMVVFPQIDSILPQINALIVARYEGITVYNLYFGYIAVMGLLGGVAALAMKRILAHKKRTHA